MEVINGFVIQMIPSLTLSSIQGWGALILKIKLWPWFVIGLFLLFAGLLIDLYWPLREKKLHQPILRPVSSEEIFDRALELKELSRSNGGEIQFSARA